MNKVLWSSNTNSAPALGGWMVVRTGVYLRPHHDAHVDAFRKWEREWYGPQGKGPCNMGSGRCLNDELSDFYQSCASHAMVVGERGLMDCFIKACWAVANDHGEEARLPAVNGDFSLRCL